MSRDNFSDTTITNKVDVSSLKNGLYLINVVTKDNKKQTIKFIKK